MHRCVLMLVMSMFLLAGCGSKSQETRDLPRWALDMKAESFLLSQQQPKVRVENEVLGMLEVLDTDDVAWESVYSFFLDAAVAEEAMESGYEFEVRLGLRDSVLIWIAQKTNRRPQMLQLIYDRSDAKLKGVQIENRANNMFYESAQSLYYAKEDSILIVGMNKLRWQGQKEYRQRIRF